METEQLIFQVIAYMEKRSEIDCRNKSESEKSSFDDKVTSGVCVSLQVLEDIFQFR